MSDGQYRAAGVPRRLFSTSSVAAAEHRANPVLARFYGPIRFGISPCSTPRPAVFSDKADKARPSPSIPWGLYFMIMFPISSLVVLFDKN